MTLREALLILFLLFPGVALGLLELAVPTPSASALHPSAHSTHIEGSSLPRSSARPVTFSSSLPPNQVIDSSVIESFDTRIDARRIEASGVLWHPGRLTYLLISDESFDGEPALYHMDHHGQILTQVTVRGGATIDDLESISTDGSYVYLLSSLSLTAKGKLKSERRQFMKLEEVGKEMVNRGSLDLYQVLERLAANTSDPGTAQFLREAFRSNGINIEAHAVRDGHLFLGFKTPWDSQGQTVILRITNLDDLFAGYPPHGSIWETVTLVGPKTGTPASLSDMVWSDDALLLLGVSGDKSHPLSYVWTYHPEDHLLRELATFTDLKAEGLSLTPEQQVYMVVADGGGHRTSRYLTVKVENLRTKKKHS